MGNQTLQPIESGFHKARSVAPATARWSLFTEKVQGEGSRRSIQSKPRRNRGLSARMSGLPVASVAKVSQIVTLPRRLLTKFVGKIPRAKLDLILAAVDTVLGKPSVKER
jgi:hypothetical protein